MASLFNLLAAFLVFSTLVSNPASAESPKVYAQMTSVEDQLTDVNTLNMPIVAKIQNVEYMEGLDFNSKTNEILIKEEGMYYLNAVAQMGAREYDNKIVKGGDIYFWMEQNKKDVPNSGGWVFASPTARSHTIVIQSLLACKKGDSIRLKFSSSSPSMGFISFESTEKWPACAGICVCIYKL